MIIPTKLLVLFLAGNTKCKFCLSETTINYFVNNFCDSCSFFEPLSFIGNIPFTYVCLGDGQAEVIINVRGGKPEFSASNGSSSNYNFTLSGSSLTNDGTYSDPDGIFSFTITSGDIWNLVVDDDLGCGPISTGGTFTENIDNCSNYCSLYPIQTQILPFDGDTIILVNNDVPLMVGISNPDSLQTYNHIWQPSSSLSCENCPSPIASPYESTEYTVTTSNDSGCIKIDTILIRVATVADPDSFLTIYPGITLNNDGRNDIFYIDGLELFPRNELIVFNRWGNIVFQATPYNNNWDGSYQGKPLPEGTYYYILRTDLGNTKTFKGSIVIIR